MTSPNLEYIYNIKKDKKRTRTKGEIVSGEENREKGRGRSGRIKNVTVFR